MGFIAHNTASWGFGWCITCNGRQDHSHFFSDVTELFCLLNLKYLILFHCFMNTNLLYCYKKREAVQNKIPLQFLEFLIWTVLQLTSLYCLNKALCAEIK